MNIEKKLYQWDTEQKLTGCTGLYVDFPIGNEVYRVETADGTCIIPDELLQTSGSHKVYECMTNNTIRSFAFSVTPRPKPPDYVYTPTERLTFEGLVQRVDDAVADMIRRAESGEFDGHTPVKGTDYFTTGEIQQIQNEVSSGAIGEFKSVVDTETDKFNANATEKVNAYNQNDSEKTASYNANATEKLNAYNSNTQSKVTEYNQNAANKTAEYNTNANNRVVEFDSHTEQIQSDVNKLKSDLVNALGDKVFINPSIEVDTIYSNSYHNGLNMSGYNTYTFSLEQGKTYHINTKVIDANGYAVCYKFKDNVWVNLEGEYPTYSGVVSDYEFVCGNDCNAIKITTYQYIPNVYCNGVTTMNIPDAISLIESSVFKNYVKFEQNECYVKAKYDDTHDIVFRINIGGGNLLPDIRYVYLVDNNGALNDDLNYSRYIISNPSDIISPHIICANENGDGDHPTMEYFTGGNHRSDNTGTGGGVTAHNVSFNVYCDDKSVSNSAFGNKITVKWVNTIAGYNTSKDDGTGREILKEEVTFEIVGPRINVNIKHTALESLSRVEYFGLQMMCDDMENIVYVGGSNRGSYDPKTASNSGDKNCRVVLISNNTNKDMIEIGIENIDLGSFANDSLAYSAFTTVAKKSYFGIIYDGLPITMAEGDITTLRGYYEFKPILN